MLRLSFKEVKEEVTQHFEAVLAQVPKGTTFFANSEPGIRLAEAIVEAVACADQVRFVSSGSEADLYAMRLARAVSASRRS